MQTNFRYQREGEPFRWILLLEKDARTVQVFCQGERREYTLPLNGPVTRTRQEAEYVFLHDDASGKHVQFKFEENAFLVGDAFAIDGEVNEFCAWVFGEDGDTEDDHDQ
jgi:hypothetical protein